MNALILISVVAVFTLILVFGYTPSDQKLSKITTVPYIRRSVDTSPIFDYDPDKRVFNIKKDCYITSQSGVIMEDKVLNITPMIKKNGGNYKVDLYILSPFNDYMNREEIKSYLDEGYSININPVSIKSMYRDKMKITEQDILLRLLRSFEDDTVGDVALLTRIIRSGGFVEHIKSLEAKLQGETK